MSEGISRHVFVQAYRPPFPDPRRWNEINYWQQYYYFKREWMVPKTGLCPDSINCSSLTSRANPENVSQEGVSETRPETNEAVQQATEEDESEDIQYELSEEWASRFAKTLENMKKRRRQQQRENEDESDSVPKKKRQTKKSNQKRGN